MSNDAYAKDGVNLTAGSAISAYAAEMNRATWPTANLVDIEDFAEGHFRGLVEFNFDLPPGSRLTGGADGIGTKAMLFSNSLLCQDAGRDLLAMCNGDLTRRGAKPLAFFNVLDTSSLGKVDSDTYHFFQMLLQGLRNAAIEQGVALLGGETAELGVGVGSDNPNALAKFNWAGFAIGATHPKARITGKDLAPRQVVVALKDPGFRSNWFSGVRKALTLKFGPDYHTNPEAQDAIKSATVPSALYDRFLAKANGWESRRFRNRIPITAIAHITGGGIKEKFAEDVVLKAGLSADLHDLWDPAPIMRSCVEWRRLDGTPFTDREVYESCHGGQGALLVLDRTHLDNLLLLARQEGQEAKVCGEIYKSEGFQRVRVTSKFSDHTTVTYT